MGTVISWEEALQKGVIGHYLGSQRKGTEWLGVIDNVTINNGTLKLSLSWTGLLNPRNRRWEQNGPETIVIDRTVPVENKGVYLGFSTKDSLFVIIPATEVIID